MSELIDNKAERVRALKEIIVHLHNGQPPDQVRSRLRQIVRETDHSEIIAMEQQLMAEGMPVEEIKSMCDLHSQVTRDVLVQIPARAVPPGHPADTFRRENAALGSVVARMRALAAEVLGAGGTNAESALPDLRQAFNELMDIEKHYERKENAFFPRLERHGITGPSKVMWAKDDETRALLKELGAALERRDAEWKRAAAAACTAALRAVEEMIYKEEHILLPMCLDTFDDEDWAVIWNASPRYGWCLVEPRTGCRPTIPVSDIRKPDTAGITLPTGNLSMEQLTAIFATIPVDITFVDAEDRVRFFSEGPDRVFARSKAIIGRKVQHCHPPRSVAVVDRILSDFREGRQNVAEFWIAFQGRFVHIRYFAVRDGAGRYAGTLEVTQDVTRIRELEGERRLLQYA